MLKGKGIITPYQQQILNDFSSLNDSDFFYLTGGTALSEFYLGHRKSYDLDLFTPETALILPFSHSFQIELGKKYNVSIIKSFGTFVECVLSNNGDSIRVQLALDSPFKFLEPERSNYGIKVNSYKDLIVDKMLAYYGRAEARDAVDLYCILQEEKFSELTKLCSKKDPGFDLYWMAIALEKSAQFPSELDRWPVEMLIQIDIADLKQMFSKLSKEIMNSIRK